MSTTTKLLYFAMLMLGSTAWAQQTDSTSTQPSSKINSNAFSGLDGMGLGIMLNNAPTLHLMQRPLVVVDGLPVLNLDAENIDFNTIDITELARTIGIAQDDIESVTVPDNEAVKALYGMPAATGVIVITTRKASKEKINVEFNSRTSLVKQGKGFDLLSGDEYTLYALEAMQNAFNSPVIAPKELAYNPDDPYYFYNYNKNTDWQQAIAQTGWSNRQQLSLSGTHKKLGFRLSSGLENQEGTTIGTSQKLITHRLQLKYDIAKGLTAGLAADVMQRHMQNNGLSFKANQMPIHEMAAKKMPNQSIYEYDEQGNQQDNYFIPSPRSIDGLTNPVAWAELHQYKKDDDRLMPSFSLAYQARKLFGYRLDVSYNQQDISGYEYTPTVFNGFYETTTKSSHNIKTWYTQNTITLSPIATNNHNLIASASLQTQNNRIELSQRSESDAGQSYSYNWWKVIGKSRYLDFSANYMAKNRYGIEATLNRYYDEDMKGYKNFNPSVTSRWIVSNEPFMKPLAFIDNLELAASYGKSLGTEQQEYTPDFTRKRLTLNLAMIKRININITRYIDDEHRSIYPVYLDYNDFYSYIGTDHYYYGANMTATNNGWLFSTAAKLVDKKEFGIDVALNLYANKLSQTWDRETELASTAYGNGTYARTLKKGQVLGEIKGYRHVGVYTTYSDLAALDAEGEVITNANGSIKTMDYRGDYKFATGDAMYADLDYNGTIDDNDTNVLGKVTPSLSGSGAASVRYRNMTLGLFVNFRYGNGIINQSRMAIENMYGYTNQSTAVLNRWRKLGDQTNIPRALYNRGYNWLGSDCFVEDGSFVRIKAINLNYKFSQRVLQKMHLKQLSCFVTCRNPFTFTSYTGLNPDIAIGTDWDTMGIDYNFAPVDKEFTFGIKIGI